MIDTLSSTTSTKSIFQLAVDRLHYYNSTQPHTQPDYTSDSDYIQPPDASAVAVGSDRSGTVVNTRSPKRARRTLKSTKTQPSISYAAVLIGLFELNNDIYVLLTQRSAQMKAHAGEVCLPGMSCQTIQLTNQIIGPTDNVYYFYMYRWQT